MSLPSFRWHRCALLLLSLLLSACGAGVPRRGASLYQGLPPDTVTSACLRGSVNCPAVMGEPTAAAMRTRVAEVGASLAGAVKAVEYLQRAQVEEALAHCALYAEEKVNGRHFQGRSPTREQCQQEVGRDAKGNGVTRAMELGREKHAVALECLKWRLEALLPDQFLLEPRYRYDSRTQEKSLLSAEEVKRLLESGRVGELVGTIAPDVGHPPRQSAPACRALRVQVSLPTLQCAAVDAVPTGPPSRRQEPEKGVRRNPGGVAPHGYPLERSPVMGEHYPRIRIPWKRSPGLAIREGLSLTFYTRCTHQELGPSALRALEVYRRTIAPGSLAWYWENEREDWLELDERGWEVSRRELLEEHYYSLQLMDTPEGRGEFQFNYRGRLPEDPLGGTECVSALSFRLSTEYLEAHGPQQVQRLALALACELPFDSGYAGLCFHAGDELGVPEKVGEYLMRYPGIALDDVDGTAMYLGTRVEGVYWMNFLGPPVLSELGGVEVLRAKLTSPDIIIEPLGEQRACIILGEWPEAGDTEQGRTLPAYRELARVLEPWLYHRHLSPYSKESTLRWERRFLD